MKRFLLLIAQLIYKGTPFSTIRQIYWNLFLKMVHNRKEIVKVAGITYDLDFNETIDAALYLQKYEPDVSEAIDRFCQNGWCALDIGANIGAHTLRIAKKTGLNGKVYAFEPAEYAYNKLLRNISLNSFTNVFPFRIALSNQDLPQQRINLRSSWPLEGGRVVTHENTIDLMRLDTWCLKNNVKIVHLIKMDVDGGEYSILEGARKLLEQCHPLILMEVGAWHFQNLNQQPLGFLQSLGYRFWNSYSLEEYAGPESVAKMLPEIDEDMTTSLNIIASPAFPGLKKK
jgi:FkbM family methyltransferase